MKATGRRGQQWPCEEDFMELMKIEKSEVVVFGKGFVPVFGFFFTGTENEFTKLRSLNKAGEIHMVIAPTGGVTFNSEKTLSSK